jgi:hypothetical protein
MRHASPPLVLDGEIDGTWFLAHIEQILCPILKPGDIVVLDNLGSQGATKSGAPLKLSARACSMRKYSSPVFSCSSQLAEFRRRRSDATG